MLRRMPTYRALIHGTDFRVQLDDEVRALSFYATRWAAGDDEEAAEEAVLDGLTEELSKLAVEGGNPELCCEALAPDASPPKLSDPGFSWYTVGDDAAAADAEEGELEAFWE